MPYEYQYSPAEGYTLATFDQFFDVVAKVIGANRSTFVKSEVEEFAKQSIPQILADKYTAGFRKLVEGLKPFLAGQDAYFLSWNAGTLFAEFKGPRVSLQFSLITGPNPMHVKRIGEPEIVPDPEAEANAAVELMLAQLKIAGYEQLIQELRAKLEIK